MVDRKKRVIWIDIVKALAIMLVVIGHSAPGILRAPIYSFHMPLFFIMSAWTSHFSSDWIGWRKNIKKSFKHLFLPAIVIFLARLAIDLLQRPAIPDVVEFLRIKALSFLFFSGAKVEFRGISVPAVGMPWFLAVLFFGKLLYDFLQVSLKNNKQFICLSTVLLSVGGVIIGKRWPFFFSIDIALAISILFSLAQILKERFIAQFSMKQTVLYFAVWLISFVLPYLLLPVAQEQHLEYATRSYPMFPICYLCAAAGTMLTAEISLFVEKHGKCVLVDMLSFLGRNSLYMFYVHCFDNLWSRLYSISSNDCINALIRLLIDLAIFAFIMRARVYLRSFRKA